MRRLIKKKIKEAIANRDLMNLPPSVAVDLIELIWENYTELIYTDLKTGKYDGLIHELMLR